MPNYEVSVFGRTPAAATAPTLTELDPITTWTSLRWHRELNAPDTYTISAPVADLPASIRTPLTHLHTTPLELQFTRDGEVVGRGPVVDLEIDAGVITINARGLLYYLDYMIVESAFSRANTDQATIIKDLIDYYQSLSYGNYGLVTSGLTTVGVLRSMTVDEGEFPTIGEKVAQWLDNLNGMDLWVDPATRQVLSAYPTRGTDLSATVVLDARVIRDDVYGVSVAAGMLASEGFATADAVTGTYADTTLRSTFGRSGVAASSSSITESATVAALAQMAQEIRATPLTTLGVGQFVAVTGVDVGDFAEGDTVGFVYDAGLGTVDTTVRLRTFAVSVEDTRELLEVGFV